MNSLFRHSKFKHTHGTPLKRNECYDNIRITKSSWDSTFCDVNQKYLAVIVESAGGGSFLVIPLSQTGRVDPKDMPLVVGHKSAVLDVKWCPHNDDVIASASEDSTVKVWMIPEGGITTDSPLTEPHVDLVLHQRRVGLILWHPTAENVLLSSGQDNLVVIWNVSTAEPLTQIEFPDFINSAAFNWNGSRLITCCKDKMLRIVCPRTGNILVEGGGHEGAKPQQSIYTINNMIVTTGFSKMSEREICIWSEDDLEIPKTKLELDTSNSTLFIHYDPDTQLVFISAKGDCSIKYFEVTNTEPYLHYLNLFTSNASQRGIGWMPKRALSLKSNEIARCFKVHQNGYVEPIAFVVPRKSDLFQDDLYPDTMADEPSLTAEEWFSGVDKDPVMLSLRDMFHASSDNLEVKKPKRIVSMRPIDRSNFQKPLSNTAGEVAIASSLTKVELMNDYVSKKDFDDLLERVAQLEEQIVKLMESASL